MSNCSPPPGPQQSVLFPIKLDAFVFNEAVCNGTPPIKSDPEPNEAEPGENQPVGAKIAPIEQPNYTFLRLDRTLVQPDILNPIELHNSWPAKVNSRYTNLGTKDLDPYARRIGVYLSWTLPRPFRSGVAAAGKGAANSQSFARARESRGLGSSVCPADEAIEEPAKDYAPPLFPSVPNRWLVIRHISSKESIQPIEAQSKVPEFAAWVVESDRQWDLKELGVEVDLQTDVSPFIAAGDGTNNETTVSKQAEVFIGKKTPLSDWNELYKPRGGTQPEDSAEPHTAKFLPHFSLLSSSNQLFPDYQPHNANVFSMCDNFDYASGKKRMTQATAHYYVVGWNAKPEDDLLTGPFLGPSQQTRKEKLNALKLSLKLEVPGTDKQETEANKEKAFQAWLKDDSGLRVLCHGTMYEVQWNSTEKPPNVPADNFCTHLNNAVPIAVGTTPLDALTTFTRAHTLDPSYGSVKEEPVTIGQLEKWITDLERHLLARDDGVETQNQASDMLYNWNFARTDGGETWNASGTGTKQPGNDKLGNKPEDMIKALKTLNAEQAFLDAILRAMVRLRRDMFVLWWRYVTDSKPSDRNTKEWKKKVARIEADFHTLQNLKDGCMTKMKAPKDKWGSKIKSGACPPYYQQRDPTLLVGGINSGWQHDYLHDLLIRTDEQVVGAKTGKTEPPPPSWPEFDKDLSCRLPKDLQSPIRALVAEWLVLRPGGPAAPDMSFKETTSPPLFHDTSSAHDSRPPSSLAEEKKPVWRDRWNESQPWFPLFLEWEIEYYHIPFEDWELSVSSSCSTLQKQLRYNIPASKDLSKHEEVGGEADCHAIQGRVLLLPQPSFSLAAKIEQLFAGTPQPVLDHRDEETHRYDYLKKEDREALQRELHQLAFLSAPLAGMSAHLTTLLQGSHIKPNMRNARTGELEPIAEALRSEAGLDVKQLKMIDIETDSTPFASAMKPPSGSHPLFKPASHGQFRFTKLNIIDKFGQAIHAVDPTPREETPPVWPCISEWYAPQLRDDGKPNVVAPRKDLDAKPPVESTAPDAGPPASTELCEFIQVPPMINQAARLNANFLVRDHVKTDEEQKPSDASTMTNAKNFWRPADEWENPVWGWVLVNYANQGIQLFTQNGTFYREVRFGGPLGAQASPSWLPFPPPSPGAAPGPSQKPEELQLERLVARLGDSEFLRAFWNMATLATDNMLPAPEAYAGFGNAALVGRPLALAHAGWSLELATDQLESQATVDKPVPRKLLSPDGQDYDSDAENMDKSVYAFKVKVGDVERGFDGLVGMFNCSKDLDPEQPTDLGVKLGTIYSDYRQPPPAPRPPPGRSEATGSVPSKPFPPCRPLVLRPFYVSPSKCASAEDYDQKRNFHLSVRAVLFDPFSTIHSYSGTLPVKELSLAPWAWQTALSKMKAFFHAGPLVLTKDVPENFDSKRQPPVGEPITKPPPIDHDEGSVHLPGLGRGDWAWLQPYHIATNNKSMTSRGVADKEGADAPERFMVLPVAAADERARFEQGPYTSVSGYLMKIGGSE